MYCTSCGQPNADTSAFCSTCGTSLAARHTATVQLTPPAPAATAGGLACPHCAGPFVTRLSLIWQHGMGTTTAQTTGVGVGLGGGIGVGTARTHGTTQSVASVIAAPPLTKSYGTVATMMVICGFGAFFFLLNGGWGEAVVTGAMAALCWLPVRSAVEFNRNVYPGLRQSWEHTYQCDRCGTRFIWPLPSQPSPEPPVRQGAVSGSVFHAQVLHFGVSERVLQHIRAGSRIQAVAAYREERGVGLADAVAEVDRITAAMGAGQRR